MTFTAASHTNTAAELRPSAVQLWGQAVWALAEWMKGAGTWKCIKEGYGKVSSWSVFYTGFTHHFFTVLLLQSCSTLAAHRTSLIRVLFPRAIYFTLWNSGLRDSSHYFPQKTYDKSEGRNVSISCQKFQSMKVIAFRHSTKHKKKGINKPIRKESSEKMRSLKVPMNV